MDSILWKQGTTDPARKKRKTILFLQSVVKSPYNLGLVGSWHNVWTWRVNELFIILEDDSEVSVRA